MYHCTIRTLDGVVVESTRAELGGKLDFMLHSQTMMLEVISNNRKP